MCIVVTVCFFFFKQKTAYEMRISDWSSDVCSSDLVLGLGHAVLQAWPAVGDEDFYVILADDLIDGRLQPCLSQMHRVYQQYGTSVLATQRVPQSETGSYGIVDAQPIGPGLSERKKMVAKPKPEEAPSQPAVVGRSAERRGGKAC